MTSTITVNGEIIEIVNGVFTCNYCDTERAFDEIDMDFGACTTCVDRWESEGMANEEGAEYVR